MNHLIYLLLGLLIGIILGSALSFLISQLQIKSLKSQLHSSLQSQQSTQHQLIKTQTQLQSQQQIQTHQDQFFQKQISELKHTFQSLSSESLRLNNQSFVNITKPHFSHFESTVQEIKNYLNSIEKSRLQDYSSLKQQIQILKESEIQLYKETQNLSQALKTPHVRGKWGEIQLKRIVEIAGMINHCDFLQQPSLPDQSRPDLIVHLPNQRKIAVDSKSIFDHFFKACQSQNPQDHELNLKKHSQSIRQQLKNLSTKEYWNKIGQSFEFVVMFLPAESFFTAALEYDPQLIEYAAKDQVILATPTTLIALLKAIAYGWKQEDISQNTQKISKIGQELFKRISIFTSHMKKIKNGLESANQSFNSAVGSLERSVIPQAKKFKELGNIQDSSKNLLHIEYTQTTLRNPLQSNTPNSSNPSN